MSDKQFYRSVIFMALISGALFGWMFGLMAGGNMARDDSRMFEKCLEWKKNYDLCKKEVYGG